MGIIRWFLRRERIAGYIAKSLPAEIVERTAVALAYRLALNQTINSILSKIKTKGIIILDEPTDGFSEEQIMKIRDILDELNVSQLIIVSHEQKIESFVDNVFKVQKNGDVSVITPHTKSCLFIKI